LIKYYKRYKIKCIYIYIYEYIYIDGSNNKTIILKGNNSGILDSNSSLELFSTEFFQTHNINSLARITQNTINAAKTQYTKSPQINYIEHVTVHQNELILPTYQAMVSVKAISLERVFPNDPKSTVFKLNLDVTTIDATIWSSFTSHKNPNEPGRTAIHRYRYNTPGFPDHFTFVNFCAESILSGGGVILLRTESNSYLFNVSTRDVDMNWLIITGIERLGAYDTFGGGKLVTESDDPNFIADFSEFDGDITMLANKSCYNSAEIWGIVVGAAFSVIAAVATGGVSAIAEGVAAAVSTAVEVSTDLVTATEAAVCMGEGAEQAADLAVATNEAIDSTALETGVVDDVTDSACDITNTAASILGDAGVTITDDAALDAEIDAAIDDVGTQLEHGFSNVLKHELKNFVKGKLKSWTKNKIKMHVKGDVAVEAQKMINHMIGFALEEAYISEVLNYTVPNFTDDGTSYGNLAGTTIVIDDNGHWKVFVPKWLKGEEKIKYIKLSYEADATHPDGHLNVAINRKAIRKGIIKAAKQIGKDKASELFDGIECVAAAKFGVS